MFETLFNKNNILMKTYGAAIHPRNELPGMLAAET
jgi:hypothetical protein